MASLEAAASSLVARDLFGGAMRIEVPEPWLDTEAFMDIIKRPVPDNQEIFVAPQNGDERPDAAQPVAMFVDVLELAGDVKDVEQLPHFHVVEILKRDERAAEAEGLAAVAGAPLELPEKVRTADGGAGASATAAVFDPCDVEVVVVRLPSCDTDLIFSLHGRIAAGGAEAAPPLAELVATLDVVEWGLFGGGSQEGEDGRLLGA